ncbi:MULTISPECIES: LysR family transcriptional regulator [Alteromonadaceae]|uniref:LysR family transcriptional regulator n=1 Tax=Alteromonadaceae TaxID=72275 RepID=UPI001C087217|nr:MULTISPECIES: LysR family transcriptional regulator [Aliiglaciecola]MBU2876893.1 LysR family transcriptional regulator [Aliiglaciecola lipolytica]MDO6713213.1 LysR family transcriptional regulator [Aliiglaciecola sp. 2_MG-2023]MDO6754301.1 LysR family transcriptional regulator [Aliiglaciecola sp. 1_MG-2023]
MRQLSLDQLRTFVTVVELGGFAKAGDMLGRSQPAISLQIKKLEEQLGRRLFDKIGQRQLVNQDGQALLQQARTMLSINDDIFRQFEQSSLRGRLRLGIPSEFATTLLPSIIGEFSKQYPDVALEVTSELSRSLLNDKNHRDFDLVLALVHPDQQTEGEVVLEDELIWVGDANKAISANKVALVLAPDGCVYRSRVIEKLKQQTTSWRITYTNADLYGLIAAIQQGLGITALARSSLPSALQEIRHKSLPQLGKIKICLFNLDTQHPQISRALADFIMARLKS